MTATVSITPTRNPWPRRVALAVLLTPAAFGMFVIAMLGVGAGPFGLLVLVVTAAIVYAFAPKASSRGVREAGAVLMGAAGGFGIFVSAIVLGIGLDILPFIGRSHDYPHEGTWMLLSVVLSVLSAVVLWSLLRPARQPLIASR